VIVFLPIFNLLVGIFIAFALDCQVDEGSAHRCLVLGLDIGGVLYTMLVSGWFILFSILYGPVGYTILALIYGIKRFKERGDQAKP
jgi:hypothetical protein